MASVSPVSARLVMFGVVMANTSSFRPAFFRAALAAFRTSIPGVRLVPNGVASELITRANVNMGTTEADSA